MTTPSHRPTLSVVAPVFNEEAILHELYRRLAAVLDGAGQIGCRRPERQTPPAHW